MRDLALAILDGRERELIPEEAAVFAIVAQDDDDLATTAKGLADEGKAGLIAIRALQKSAVVTLDFFKVVAGHDLEGWVDIDERQVRVRGAGDRDAAGDGAEDAAVELELFHGGAEAADKGAMREEDYAELGEEDGGLLRQGKDAFEDAGRVVQLPRGAGVALADRDKGRMDVFSSLLAAAKRGSKGEGTGLIGDNELETSEMLCIDRGGLELDGDEIQLDGQAFEEAEVGPSSIRKPTPVLVKLMVPTGRSCPPASSSSGNASFIFLAPYCL